MKKNDRGMDERKVFSTNGIPISSARTRETPGANRVVPGGHGDYLFALLTKFPRGGRGWEVWRGALTKLASTYGTGISRWRDRQNRKHGALSSVPVTYSTALIVPFVGNLISSSLRRTRQKRRGNGRVSRKNANWKHPTRREEDFVTEARVKQNGDGAAFRPQSQVVGAILTIWITV